MALTSIKASVAEQISKSSPIVQTAVTDALVKKELDRRTETILKAYTDIGVKQKALNKLRADVETFDEAGKALPKVFSKAQNEARKKMVESIDKVTKTVNAAFETNDFTKLYELFQ
jgi:putative heme degradation protein